jgi:hypothetical protein
MAVENKTKVELLKQPGLGCICKIEVQICAIINKDEANLQGSTRCGQKEGAFSGRSYDS